MKRQAIILILVLAAALSAAADFHAPDFRFSHFSTDNGLPSNRIRDIVQDNEGFMWFATEAGLVRYDGTSTKVFVPYAGNTNAFETYILSVCKNGGTLLIGTDQNLYSYCPRKEQMRLFPLRYSQNVNEKLSGAVHDICVDNDGTIWVAVEGKGVFKISPDGNVTDLFSFPELQNFIGMLYVDSDNMVWGVSSTGDGVVLKYDRNSGSFVEFPIIIDGEKSSFN